MQRLIDKASVLIEALPYIQEFRDSLVVVKFGGSAMENPECTRGVLRDIVFMECAGMKPIIVQGGRAHQVHPRPALHLRRFDGSG